MPALLWVVAILDKPAEKFVDTPGFHAKINVLSFPCFPSFLFFSKHLPYTAGGQVIALATGERTRS